MSPRAAGDDLVARSRAVLDRHWRAAGYTAPNETVYPWQWLWDSCFHALVWDHLGEPWRALAELERALGVADPSGFVPHMVYDGPGPHVAFWGRAGVSSITQPPIHGHTLAVMSRRGVDVPEALLEGSARAIRHLLVDRPRHRSGLVALCHPWESGCDDSPRFDDTCPPGWTAAAWKAHKGDLVAAIVRDDTGAPSHNPLFDVGSVGFSALVGFCAAELVTVRPDAELDRLAGELAGAVADRWDGELGTWVDAGEAEAGSGRIRTLDAALGVLVDRTEGRVDAVAGQIVDPTGFGSPWGPAGVHRAEPAFDPDAYWRGPVWPQLGYLAWVALERAGRGDAAATVAAGVVEGARASGLAEYWSPDTGRGHGAIPQSWATLALLMNAALEGTQSPRPATEPPSRRRASS